MSCTFGPEAENRIFDFEAVGYTFGFVIDVVDGGWPCEGPCCANPWHRTPDSTPGHGLIAFRESAIAAH